MPVGHLSAELIPLRSQPLEFLSLHLNGDPGHLAHRSRNRHALLLELLLGVGEFLKDVHHAAFLVAAAPATLRCDVA